MLLRIQGSHHVYGKPGQRARISVPVHGKAALKRGLQQRLMKLAAIDPDVALDRRMAATTRWERGGFVLGRKLPGDVAER